MLIYIFISRLEIVYVFKKFIYLLCVNTCQHLVRLTACKIQSTKTSSHLAILRVYNLYSFWEDLTAICTNEVAVWNEVDLLSYLFL